VVALLAVLATSLTCGLAGLVAAPNASRVVARAAARGGEPRAADLWTLDGWFRRALIGLGLAVGLGLASVVPVAGPVAFAAAVLWAPFLAVDTDRGVAEVFRTAWDAARGRLVANAILAAIVLGLGTLALSACVLPAVVVWPWLALSLHAAWEADRDRALALSAAR
jgi:hypothetical protein